MKLVVGLGNPGKEYEGTRHNIGFSFLDYYLNEKGFNPSWKNKFQGLYCECNINGEKIIFLKPQSYMNLSGTVVERFLNFFKLTPSDLFVISDDLDLNIGNYKLKDKGSCGGHNGLRNIESCIHTQQYKRLKIGISNDKSKETKDYVLGKFSSEERNILQSLFESLVFVLDDFFKVDFLSLMSCYNRKNR
jgi:PTH1 family peptidyl-tRNA hydrolase